MVGDPREGCEWLSSGGTGAKASPNAALVGGWLRGGLVCLSDPVPYSPLSGRPFLSPRSELTTASFLTCLPSPGGATGRRVAFHSSRLSLAQCTLTAGLTNEGIAR